MADTYTTNLNLTKPEPGAAEDTWGISLNADLDSLDAIFSSSGTQINLNPNQINFADGKKAIFGTGSDLQIYHDGSHSYIQDSGSGNLRILVGDLQVRNYGTNENIITSTANAEVALYYNASEKLATTSSGIDVTGTVTSDGLTVDGNILLNVEGNELQFNTSSTPVNKIYTDDTYTANGLTISADNGVALKSTNNYLLLDDTGTNEMVLNVDGGERLRVTSTGIDVTGEGKFTDLTNGGLVHARGLDASLFLDITSGNNAKIYYDSGDLEFKATNPTAVDSSVSMKIAQNRDISFYDSTGTTQGFFWDASDEQLGIGTTNPTYTLDVNSGTANDTVRFKSSDDTVTIVLEDDDSFNEIESSAVGIRFDLSGSEKLRVNSSGIDVTGTVTSDGLTVTKASGDIATLEGSGTTADVEANLVFNPVYDVNARIVSAREGASLKSILSLQTGEDNTGATKQRLKIGGSGDISFYDDTGSTQGLFWDASTERLGIGNTSPKSLLNVTGTGSDGGILTLENDSTSLITDRKVGRINFYSNDGSANGTGVKADIKAIAENSIGSEIGLAFGTSGTGSATAVEAMRISADGNVGIGTDSPSALIHGSGSNAELRLQHAGNSYYQRIFTDSSNNLKFGTGANGTERMRLDASGNLLAGKTSTNFAVAGTQLAYDGAIVATRSANPIITLNRLSTDGQIQRFFKDGTQVGSIGTNNDDLLIYSTATGHKGLRFAGGEILPVSNAGALEDNTTDLGSTAYRFKNLQLSGTAYIGTQLGLGTTNPGATLDVTNASGQAGIDVDSFTGNNSYISFKENGTSRFSINHDTSGNALTIYNSYGSSEAARIDSSGNLLVGTTSQISAGKLSVSGGTAANGITATTDATAGYAAASFQRTASVGTAVQFKKGASEVGSISVTSSATTYNTSSDARLKDVTGEARGLEVITKLNPVAYNWKADGKADEGLIAQEVKELVPNAVTGSEDEHYQMDYSKLVTHLVKAVQELEQQTIELKKEIANLKGE